HQLSATKHPVLRSIGRALPQNYYPQEVISAALWKEWDGSDAGRARFERLHRSVGVRGRHLALPMEDYRALDSFSKMNDKWIERTRFVLEDERQVDRARDRTRRRSRRIRALPGRSCTHRYRSYLLYDGS